MIKFKMATKMSFFATFAIHTHNFTDLLVSATIRHTLIVFVTFPIIPLLSVTSPSANQQPDIHKSHKVWCTS